ncbi:uncharacterized protein N0V89_000140 [Didymosphaeria variabile]|uniref:F-box domain-containing protein n=1 Tax=Didymosphaeria variabile TaxID=1932322 RepID=A0A9W9CFL1_9PLEO|nr:uncharacterized protein N0V89_000140 [Didymosphaeria variabile]KAJ4359585.1 hypothetical protein N0V89_000140 [Didymosphaeria variabile]
MTDLPLRVRPRGPERKLAPASTPSLDKLPVELLEIVTNNLGRPIDIVNLALTCTRLRQFVQLYGWEAFLKGRFGLFRPSGDAKSTAHGLTTLYRNWDRKAFTARYLEPSKNVTSLNSGDKIRWRGPQGQTMGYQPSVDSYEEMGSEWVDRKEVLAWSAGANVVVRVKETGHRGARVWQEMGVDTEDPHEPGMFGHPNAWYTYKIPESFEGRDDITALKLLRPHQKSSDIECTVFGTASGRLSMLSADLEQRRATEQLYDTSGRAVGSISVSAASEPLIAASLGDSSIALYSGNYDQTSGDPVESFSEVRPIEPGMRVGRIWSTNFISDSKLAIGLGPTLEPIQVYGITPGGLTAEPLRKINLNSSDVNRTFLTGSDAVEHAMRHIPRPYNTSVYPIIPIPTESQGGSSKEVFLSGGYDGLARLHDLRSPHDFETVFWDVTNDSAVYSLACQGLERFVAGSSMHSMLKVFDLRFSGSHAYHTIPIPPATNSRPKRQDHTYNAIIDRFQDTDKRPVTGGWNVFLSPRNSRPGGARHPYRPGPRNEDSPVYSLSIPSPYSTNIYAGLEGCVQNLTFVSVLDAHPDPLLSHSSAYLPERQRNDIKAMYNPYNDVLNLGMYEQGSEEGLGMQLLTQDDVSSALAKNETRKEFSKRRGLDERWKDPSEEAGKWVRDRCRRGIRVGE